MKITFKTYLNDRLNQVDFHGVLTYPLYVQLTYGRKTIFFKSYYFELFSKLRYFLVVPGVGSKGPTLEEVIEREHEVIAFIIEKHKDDFSLELFKQAYSYYSKDLCDLAEKGFVDYLNTFFWDKGMPALAETIKHGAKHCIAYDIVRDLKRSLNKPLYEELVENSFFSAPPYLPIYGFMAQTKRWPMLILTVMEWKRPETQAEFKKYATLYYPAIPMDELVIQVNKWAGSPVK